MTSHQRLPGPPAKANRTVAELSRGIVCKHNMLKANVELFTPAGAHDPAPRGMRRATLAWVASRRRSLADDDDIAAMSGAFWIETPSRCAPERFDSLPWAGYV